MTKSRASSLDQPTRRTPPAVEQRIKKKMLRQGTRGLYMTDRKLALALKRERLAMLSELGGIEKAPASATALVDMIVRGRLILDSIDALLLEYGSTLVNRRRKELYPLVRQRQDLADSLTGQLKTFNEMKVTTEIEQRILALEEGRAINVSNTS